MSRLAILLLVLTPLVGCGSGKSGLPKTYPVKGTVSDAKGHPLEGGALRFEPSPAGDIALVATIKGGTFTARTIRDNETAVGLPAGEYKVTIEQLIPEGGRVPPPPVTLRSPYKIEAKDNDLKIALPKR